LPFEILNDLEACLQFHLAGLELSQRRDLDLWGCAVALLLLAAVPA
jgi:hypothetical protein